MKVNENFSLLRSNYLFSTMSRKIKDYKIAHPEADIIDLGIGDVSRPLPEACIKAMHSAVNEMADAATFRGYPPERGYDFLIDKILKYDFAARGITLERDEIFISDGAKSDTGSIGDIFSPECKVAVCDPRLPGLYRHKHHGGQGRQAARKRQIFKYCLSRLHRRERIYPSPAGAKCRYNISLLPQQSHGNGDE